MLMMTSACRNYRVTGMAEHAYLHQTYVRLKVYHATEAIWTKTSIVPIVSIGSSCIIIGLYVTIRETVLPLPIYIAYLYATVACIGTTFWLCYDIVRVRRASEALVEKLTSATTGQ